MGGLRGGFSGESLNQAGWRGSSQVVAQMRTIRTVSMDTVEPCSSRLLEVQSPLPLRTGVLMEDTHKQ